MRTLRLMTVLPMALLLAAAACTGPTGYQEIDPVLGGPYGYRDKQIGPDEFSVYAVGNAQTELERVAEIALMRAAHLTLEHGGDHFIVSNEKTELVSNDDLVTVPVVLPGIFLPVPVIERTVDEPVAILVVQVLPVGAEVPPGGLEAAAIVAHLRPRLGAE